MKEKSKAITGLKTGSDFSESERHDIIQDYLSSGKQKAEIWFKYTGNREEHGNLLKWMRMLGYNPDAKRNRSYIFAENSNIMSKKKTTSNEDTFETLQLKKRIEELEKQLKDAEMKAIAFSTMIDIAEKNLNIPIRKKANTKPLKK